MFSSSRNGATEAVEDDRDGMDLFSQMAVTGRDEEESLDSDADVVGGNDRVNDDDLEITAVDRYGFYLSDNYHKGKTLPQAEMEARKLKEVERCKKWLKMIRQWDFVVENRASKLKKRIRKGVPDSVRGVVWGALLGEDILAWKQKQPIEALQQVLEAGGLDERTRDEIERDIDRTFPRHIYFDTPASGGQKSLRRVLQWYALVDPETGYCQGMGFIAAMFLTYMIEEDAFYTLVSVLQRSSAPLRGLYLPKMIKAQEVLYVFGELGSFYLPTLWSHLQENSIHPSMFATEWIMTVFTRGFSFEFVTRVWDIFLHEDMKIIYRVALALLKSAGEAIFKASFEEIMQIIRNLPQSIDVEDVMRICWTIPVRHSKIKEFEEAFVVTGSGTSSSKI